jgi:hypothetical protein
LGLSVVDVGNSKERGGRERERKVNLDEKNKKKGEGKDEM